MYTIVTGHKNNIFKEYFKLQILFINRKFEEIGISQILSYLIIGVVFCGLSLFLFLKTGFAEYFYGIIALSVVLKLSKKERNDFLKVVFSVENYKKIRIVENLLTVMPFIVFLLIKQSFLISLALLILSVVLSFFNFNNRFNYTIQTPFGKKPFEFLIGFRKTFYYYIVVYFITYQAISANNFNLGVFSILAVVIIVLTYYAKPENEYFVWSFNSSPKYFLLKKLGVGLVYFTFLSSPIVIALIVFFPKEITTLIMFVALSYFYVITIILAKYSSYPNEVNLPEGMLLGLSLLFPPLLIGVIPFFYSKSIKHLKPILAND